MLRTPTLPAAPKGPTIPLMTASILWADDEIDLLRPHVLFLQQKGYSVDTVNNGLDAVEKAQGKEYDIIFLDENMPGLSGLETLNRIKNVLPHVPVIMITKSEEEHIMEEAIGGKISDYLIKPVNPNQILLSLKKHLEGRRLVSEKTNSSYQQQFRQLAMRLSDRLGTEDWKQLYDELVKWELDLSGSQDQGMTEILRSQWTEANEQFCRFVERNYLDWLQGKGDSPLMSHQLFKVKVAPLIDEKQPPLFMVLIDNLRLDQWRVLEPIVGEFFRIEEQGLFYSILPTATQYARNALFAGLMPSEIEKRFPGKWVSEDEEGSKNANEEEFVADQLKRLGKNVKHSYHKITQPEHRPQAGRQPGQPDGQCAQRHRLQLRGHAQPRTHGDGGDPRAGRGRCRRTAASPRAGSSTRPCSTSCKGIAERGGRLVITTDHGTIRVTEPSKVVGDRNTNTNLRYKHGRNLTYEASATCWPIKDPAKAFLPKANVSTVYVFAKKRPLLRVPQQLQPLRHLLTATPSSTGASPWRRCWCRGRC
jgi:CheY-like chemotaxis protein